MAHLEALLLLRSQCREWTFDQLGGRLYIPPATVTRLVEDLQTHGLVQCIAGAVSYAPENGSLSAAVDELAETYARQLVQITKLIHSVNDRKATRFAEAFYVRKGDH